MDLQFIEIIPKAGPLLWGALYTIFVGVIACGVGILVGTGLLLMRNSRFWLLRTFVRIYGSFIRGTPALVQILVFYYALAPLTGINIGPFTAGIMAVGFNSGAYVAEILRGGLSRIPKGQWEAADSLGLSALSKYRFVVGPQVLTAITPPLAGQAISLVKDTSIVSLISIQEMTFVGTEMANSSGLIFEIWLIVGFVYFALCFALSRLFKVIEQRSSAYINHQ